MDALWLLLAVVLIGVIAWGVSARRDLGKLTQRVSTLEEAIAALRASRAPPQAMPAEPAVAAAVMPAVSQAPSITRAHPPVLPPAVAHRPAPEPSAPGRWSRWIGTVAQWFRTGNVPVKVGMLVMLAGVAALLKYGSDQGWFHVSMALRLGIVAALAVAGLALGWWQRGQRRVFALALQGGAIGVLLLTVFAACRLYGLIGTPTAFALSVLLVVGVCVLAVLQDSRTLAVLGILAGFLAPLWLSSSSGNHVVLFSYYALLNLGVFAMAWLRPWRVLHLLGFAFTFGIGTLWALDAYRPAHYASTQPFLLLFFVFYLLIPVLQARRQPMGRGRVEGTLVFGTPLVAFSLQAGLLDGERQPLALCALALALLYAALGWVLVRRERYALLGGCHVLLAVGFATLAIPLALSARTTASLYALEGAALIWLGLRQQRELPIWSGAGLQLVAAFALLFGMATTEGASTALLNATFMGTVLLALAGMGSARCLQLAGRSSSALLAYLWGLLWWLVAGGHEILRFVSVDARADVALLCVIVTGWLAAEWHRRWPARALEATVLVGFVAVVPLAFAQCQAHAQPFAGWGGLGWAAVAVLGLRSVMCLRQVGARQAAMAQLLWWWLWPFAFWLLARSFTETAALADGWTVALRLLPWMGFAALALWRWPWLALGAGQDVARYRQRLLTVIFSLLGAAWLLSLLRHGSAAPLGWMPVLNPLELVQLLIGVMATCWMWRPEVPAMLRQHRGLLVAVAGFLWLTGVTLRGVHQWGGVAWDAGLWHAMPAQTSLTVIWSLLGVVAWVSGSRRGQRGLWRFGAVLMGVVLLKLVLIDRQHLGNLTGIASFLAYGLLCTLVGYLAPAPPRAPADDNAVDTSATGQSE